MIWQAWVEGPIDVVGDIHGCYEEFTELLERLGYDKTQGYRHPESRTLVLVGDPVNRGPHNIATLRLVLALIETGVARMVQSNHMEKLEGFLRGEDVPLDRGLEHTAAEWEKLSAEDQADLRHRTISMARSLPLCLFAEGGKTVIVHAGVTEELLQNHAESERLRSFCLYGDTFETLPNGRKTRRDWASNYDGDLFVVHGHTACRSAVIRHNTVDIDTGCVWGGNLTAIRLPERSLLSVPAQYEYASPTSLPEEQLREFPAS